MKTKHLKKSPVVENPKTLPWQELNIILRALDSVIYREENEYHWLIAKCSPLNYKYEGSALEGLHKSTRELKQAKEKLIDLYEEQYKV